MTYPNDPYIALMRACYRAGATIKALARIFGIGEKTASRIVRDV